MKYMNTIFLVFTDIVLLINSKKNENKFLPYLPIGEYRLNYKSLIKCDSNPNSDIQLNFYLNKISTNTTELKGIWTLKKPLDDSFTVNMNFAVKDSIGGWKDNAHVFITPNACSSLKHYSGSFWNQICSSLGINSTKCPIPPGVYNLNNLSLLSTVSDTNFPKTFFYGTYKVRFYFSDNLKTQHGCIAYVIEVKRPWEMD